VKAAVCREFGKPLLIEEVNLAEPGPGELRVRVAACAICYSDIHFAEGAWGGDLPAVYGHEAAGVVEQVGAGVDAVAPGDHVVVTLIRSCGQCHYCSRGLQVACERTFPLDLASPLSTPQGLTLGHGLRTGAFAEWVVVEASQVVAVPKQIPFASASLLACGVITGFGAVANTAQVRPGDHVVVIGTGGVGLNSVQGSRHCGAATIVAVDLSDDKLEAALSFGATHAINPVREDVLAAVRSVNAGRGADYVFVTVGVKAAFEQAYRLLAPAGAAVLVGMPADGVMTEIEPVAIAGASQRILGTKMGAARIRIDIPYLVSLYRQGRLKLDELVSGRYRLEQINEAIASVKRGEALRHVIVF
jgi:Zn-dependent alcohol dehydrogenase